MANDKLVKDLADVIMRLRAIEVRLASLEGALVAVATGRPIGIVEGKVVAVEKNA